MALEFQTEDDLQAALTGDELPQMTEEQEMEEMNPLVFESEAALEEAMATPPIEQQQEQSLYQPEPSGDMQQPQQMLPQQPQQEISNVPSAADLTTLLLGRGVPQEDPASQGMDRKSILANYGRQNNTLAQKLPPGLAELHPADLEPAARALAASFMSMSSTGIILDPSERVMYVTSIMENTTIRSDVRAQLIDQAMRDGKILPQALPAAWYEARGLLLLPPDLDLNSVEGGLREETG